MRVLKLDDIVSAVDLALEEVEVPEWGGVVFLRGLTAGELEHLENAFSGNTDREKFEFAVQLLAISMVSQDGQRIVTEDRVGILRDRSAAVVFRLVKACGEINHKDFEDLVGNSPSGPAAALSTA